jgi:penicillin-binding protein 2
VSSGARIKVLIVASWVLFLLLATRLYALQVKHHDEFQVRAERRRRRVDFEAPRRGRIVDRNGTVLAFDRPIEDVIVDVTELDPSLELVPALARATRAPIHEVARRFREARALVREGAHVAEVARAVDEPGRLRAERLAARFPGLATAPLADGGFAVMAPASIVSARDEALDRLAAILGQEAPALRALVQKREDEIREIKDRYARLHAWSEPIVVAEDVGFDQAAAVEEASVETPGIGVQRRFQRTYPQGSLAAHVVGYIQNLSDAEVAAAKKAGTLLDEDEGAGGLLLGVTRELPEGARLRSQPVGRAGLEAKLDRRLAGVPGARVVERDAGDRSRETLLEIKARDGEDVTVTLDSAIQAACEAALDEGLAKHGEPGAGGAVALLSIETGDVLALASGPRYDPTAIRRDFALLRADPASPLLHRAVEPVPPGSTFKALSAFAFFGGDGGLSPETRFVCEGALVPGKKGFHCDATHGPSVGLELALAESCNVFFFRAADARGVDPLAAWAARVGFGALVGQSIPGERRGRFPDRDWKQRRLEDALATRDLRTRELAEVGALSPEALAEARAKLEHATRVAEAYSRDLVFGPGSVRNAAIGQGDDLATPVQVARLAALVGSGGRVPELRLLASDARTEEVVALDPRVLALVQAGLAGCVQHGTASKTPLAGLDVAGKTGTAERAAKEPNYAWFMGYYPASAPEIAFAVLIDRTAGHGGDVCAPIARKAIDAYARSRGEQPKRR